MAERRMFAKTMIDSDAFLEMPVTAQLLYFHLSMRADDDGFVNKPKSITRMCGCSEDDMSLLIQKKFLIYFEEKGIVVIKHWKIHNYIAKDRYKETKYKAEKATLNFDENNAYTFCIQSVDETGTQDRLGKDRLGKDRLGKDRLGEESFDATAPKKHGSFCNVILSDEEFEQLQLKFPADYQKRIENLSSYIASTGKKYDSHYATIINWASKEDETKASGQNKSKSGNPFLDLLNQEGGALSDG